MHRAIRYGTLIGALLLGAGCESQSGPPAESTFVPRPKQVPASTAAASLGSTRMTGYVLDPEAFFLSFVDCLQACQPPLPSLPPILLDNNPLFLRSVVVGAQVSLQDRSGSAGALPTGVTDPLGSWVLEKVPNRAEVYYPTTNGTGALPTVDYFPVLTPLPPAEYVPTVTLRPLAAGVSDSCYGIESNALSKKGILEAVAIYLSLLGGTPTTVDDLLNPAKYAGVTVFWLGNPGFPYLRAPAENTTVEATAGQVINLAWAPPGVLPPEAAALQSERGFFGIPDAPVSPLGIVAVVVPAAGAPATVKYSFTDPQTDAANARPWIAPAIEAPLTPGVATFGGIQLYHSTGPAWAPSPFFCNPL